MLAHFINDIEKKVERHIELAKLLTVRNEDLSAKIVGLEIALEEKNKEILAERQNVETQLETIKNQSTAMEKMKNRCEKLEKDMEQVRLTARETWNSSAVSDFLSAISSNTEKMEQFKIENDKLRNTVKAFDRNQKNTDRLVEQNNILIQQMAEERDQLRNELKMWKEREQQSKFYSEKLVDKNTHLLQQINQLQTEMQILRDVQKTKNIEEAGRQYEQSRSTPQQRLAPLPPAASPPGASASSQRISAQQQRPREEQQRRVGTNDTQLITKGGQMQNCNDGNISGKFVFVSCLMDSSFLSSNNVEYINYWENNLDSLAHNISSYKKELLVSTWWKFMNATSGYANYYANLLSLCRQWKRLRPDGEIHCLYWYRERDSPSEPDKEIVSLLTTCNKCLWTDDNASIFSAIRKYYWPEFVDSILSEKIKKKYPK